MSAEPLPPGEPARRKPPETHRTRRGHRRGGRDVVVVTSLADSRAEEIRDRERRYIAAMLFRVVCFVLAVVLFSGPARYLAIAVALITPWLAVVFANQPRRLRGRRPTPVVPRDRPTRPLDPPREHRVIDADEP